MRAKILRILFAKDLNAIDALTIFIALDLLFDGRIVAMIVVWIIGPIISGTGIKALEWEKGDRP